MSRLSPLIVLLALPAVAATVDPSADGRFAVGVTTRTFVDTSRNRTLVTEVWYPAETAGRDAPLRHGHYRLVLVAHGHCGFRTNYEYLTVPLASWGFLVAAPDFPGLNKTDCEEVDILFSGAARDLVFLRSAFHDPAGPARDLAGAIRGRRAGLAGHSLGGLAVVKASLQDPALTAVVALAPFAFPAQAQKFAGQRPRRSVLVAGATNDTTIGFDDFVLPFFEALPPPAFLLKIVGGTHSGFTDMDSHLSPEELTRQHVLTRRYATAFFESYLVGARRFRTFLTAEDAAAQGTDVEVTARPH